MTADNVCAGRALEQPACWAWPDAEERRLHARREASGVGGRTRVRRLLARRLACSKARKQA